MTSRLLPAAALAGIGLLTLSGCAMDVAEAATSGSATSTTDSAPASAASYADGTYTARAGYQAPSGTESITVDLTVADGIVTAVTVQGDARDQTAAQFQAAFASAIAGEVVGEDIATLDVTRVAGASLTTGGFATALDDIRGQAS
jgi:uncharacterized protein with FMN-binding domain